MRFTALIRSAIGIKRGASLPPFIPSPNRCQSWGQAIKRFGDAVPCWRRFRLARFGLVPRPRHAIQPHLIPCTFIIMERNGTAMAMAMRLACSYSECNFVVKRFEWKLNCIMALGRNYDDGRCNGPNWYRNNAFKLNKYLQLYWQQRKLYNKRKSMTGQG